MAEKKVEAEAIQSPAETFDAREISQNALRLFGYSTDLATAAFEVSGVKRCTLEEARKIIKDFAERKVQ